MTGTGTCHIRHFCALKQIHRHQPKTRKNIKPLGLSDSRASLVRAFYDCSSFTTFLPSPERVVDGCGVVDEKFVCVIEAGVNGCHTACQQRLAVLQFYNLLLWLYIYSFHTFFFYLITTLSFARARSRSEEFEQARFFSHLITTFLPLFM